MHIFGIGSVTTSEQTLCIGRDIVPHPDDGLIAAAAADQRNIILYRRIETGIGPERGFVGHHPSGLAFMRHRRHFRALPGWASLNAEHIIADDGAPPPGLERG